MKKIFLVAAAVSLAVLTGCGNHNNSNNTQHSETAEKTHIHSHAPGEVCSDETAVDAHDTHSHAEGENCKGDDGHDHSHDSHEEHDHSHDAHDHSGNSNDGHDGHDHEEMEDPDVIVFPASQAARTDFEVQRVQRGTFRETIRCGGEVNASQSEVSVVTAPIAGVVTFVDGRVMANSTVNSGQGLFRVSSSGLASGDAVLKAQIAFQQAEADFERIKTLYEDKLVTQREYLAAEGEYLLAKAEYEPVRNSDNKGTLIKAPSSGYVLQMSVAPGDYVEMGQPLATIAKSGRMQLKALVSQRYFENLGNISDANFKLPSSNRYYNVKDLNGRLYSSGRIVSSGSSLIPVVFEFDGNGRFPDGAYAEVVLLGRERSNVTTLPLSAITEQQGLYYVYVQIDPEHYRRQQVWLGDDDGVNVEIIRGLDGCETVVTKGAINVKMASASDAIPHGHSH